jgi:hypothetical protein
MFSVTRILNNSSRIHSIAFSKLTWLNIKINEPGVYLSRINYLESVTSSFIIKTRLQVIAITFRPD